MAQLLQQDGQSQIKDFQGFGSSLITRSARKPIAVIHLENDRLACRKLVRDYVPRMPGVYGWLDKNNQLVYVGKSKSLRYRILQYFDKSTPDPKMERIRDQSQSIIWEAMSHELLALLREQELIVKHRPPMNVQGQPHRRQPGFVCMSEGTAPKAYFARKLSTRSKSWFGPISGTGQLNAAIVSLNYAFKLRDCPDKTRFQFNNQLQLFERMDHAQCLRFELNSCPAPCAGACSAADYASNVQKALEFLRGDISIMERLTADMERHAAQQQYERAAVLRDQLEGLQWISRQLERLREAETLLNGVYQLPGISRVPIWLWLRRGEIIGCHTKSRVIPKSVQKQLRQASHESNLSKNILNTYLKLLMVSWFRKHPEEKEKLLNIVQIPSAEQAAA